MVLSPNDIKVIKQLDDGSLYAQPDVVRALYDYHGMCDPELIVAYDDHGHPLGYLPVGRYQYYEETGPTSYIAAIPGSPPISPTYTPGAEHVLSMLTNHYDADVIPIAEVLALDNFMSWETASAYVLPVEKYLGMLSASRRRDIRRKLKQAETYEVKPGNLQDIRIAWEWMRDIWDQRGDFPTPYGVYLETTLNWLEVMQRSPRALLKIEKYLLNSELVGVNCCVIHYYQDQMLCDDYLCWFNPQLAGGLGIISAIRNLTDPDRQGFRYNLGSPGTGYIYDGHEYKLSVIPWELRLTQAVCHIPNSDDLLLSS